MGRSSDSSFIMLDPILEIRWRDVGVHFSWGEEVGEFKVQVREELIPVSCGYVGKKDMGCLGSEVVVFLGYHLVDIAASRYISSGRGK